MGAFKKDRKFTRLDRVRQPRKGRKWRREQEKIIDRQRELLAKEYGLRHPGNYEHPGQFSEGIGDGGILDLDGERNATEELVNDILRQG